MNSTPRRDDRDRGATLALVVILLTVLLACGAIVIDLGFLYVERRPLQNGADAAALAVAQDCAMGNCFDEWATARTAASANASTDGFSAVDVVCGGGPTAATAGLAPCVGPNPPGITDALGWVKVTTSTLDASGGTQIDFLLDAFVGALSGKTVHATAIAAWGIASRGRVLPFVIPECEFNQLGGSIVNGTVPTGEVYIYSEATSDRRGRRNGTGGDTDAPCITETTGDTLPGNFGWIDADGECLVEVSVGGQPSGDTGNDPNPIRQNCDPALIQGAEVLLAVYNDYDAQGTRATYTLVAITAFRITGYYLSGSSWPAGFTCPPPPGTSGTNTGSLRCFRGEFTRFSTDGDFGGGYDTGVRSVKMIG